MKIDMKCLTKQIRLVDEAQASHYNGGKCTKAAREKADLLDGLAEFLSQLRRELGQGFTPVYPQDPPRSSPKPDSNHIVQFFHCKTCLADLPENVSPRDWIKVEVGWTKKGLQVWCVRCEKNVIAVDLLGQKIALEA